MQTNTTPTLLQAIRQDPDTGLRWAMRDYAALVRGIVRRILPGHDRDIEECTAAASATGGAHLCSTKYYLRFWLSSCRTSLAVSALRIMRYCHKNTKVPAWIPGAFARIQVAASSASTASISFIIISLPCTR